MENDRQRIVVLCLLVVAGVAMISAAGAQSAAAANQEYNVTNGTHYNASDGPEIVLTENITTDALHPFEDNNTLNMSPNGKLSSPGPTYVEVGGLNASWTTFSNMSVNQNPLTASLSNKQTVTVSGDTDHFEYRDMAVDDGANDFRYGGPDGGTTDVTIHNLPANTTIAAWDRSTDTRLDFATTNSNGVLKLSLPQSDHTVSLESSNEPQVDNSSATPTGPQSTVPDQLAIDVSHKDFPDTSVDVEFYADGEKIGNETLTSNGTASVSSNIPSEGGTHNWYAVATDDYGNTVESKTFEYSIPDTLYIYNESDPDSLISNKTVEVEFYFDNGQTVTRNTTDGTINMSGLPAGTGVVAVAEADGFHPRAIYLDGLAEEGNIYLLNTSEKYVDLTFKLQDFTGEYPSDDTVLKIQRVINGSYQTVEGDYFGATGEFTTQLKYNKRHRLVLINTETGQRNVLGTITPTSSGTRTIRVTDTGALVLEDTDPTISIDPSVRALAATDGASITASVAPDSAIDEWTLTATYKDGSGTSEVLLNKTYTDATSASPAFNLTGKEGGKVVIDVQVTTTNGSTMTETVTYSVKENFQHDYSLFAILGGFTNLLPGDGEGATTFLTAVITVLVTASSARLLRLSPEGVGGVALTSIGFFALIGWASMDLVFAAGITGLVLFALQRGI